MKLIWKLIFITILMSTVSSCTQMIPREKNEKDSFSSYGVFLGLEGKDAIKASEGYEKVVIDAQYLDKEEILLMQKRGQQVYTYLNIGSLENFRPYFEQYQYLTKKAYQNWEEEYWIDVSSKEWQQFIKEKLSIQLLKKGVDGFWVDNVDVYSQLSNEETYLGVETILKNLNIHGKPVILNSGNEFVELFFQKNNQVDDILTGVNQETVFSTIDFEHQTFGIQSSDEKKYYLEYLNLMDDLDKDIFLLEYTTDGQLKEEIQKYAKERGWEVYISDSIELDTRVTE